MIKKLPEENLSEADKKINELVDHANIDRDLIHGLKAMIGVLGGQKGTVEMLEEWITKMKDRKNDQETS